MTDSNNHVTSTFGEAQRQYIIQKGSPTKHEEDRGIAFVQELRSEIDSGDWTEPLYETARDFAAAKNGVDSINLVAGAWDDDAYESYRAIELALVERLFHAAQAPERRNLRLTRSELVDVIVPVFKASHVWHLRKGVWEFEKYLLRVRVRELIDKCQDEVHPDLPDPRPTARFDC